MNRSITKLGRLSVLALLLIGGPIQAAIPMLACATMGLEQRAACCCEGELPSPCNEQTRGEQLPGPDRHCDCCEITLTPIDTIDVASLTADALSHPPAAAPPAEAPRPAPVAQPLRAFLPPAERHSAASTYLLTARLRL